VVLMPRQTIHERIHADLAPGEKCALCYPCPTCRAPAGSWCKRPSGHKAMDIHKDRWLSKRG